MRMTFGDGFLFGCGFWLAVLVAYVILLVVGVIIVLVTGATLIGFLGLS